MKMNCAAQNNIRFVTSHHSSPIPMRNYDESKTRVTEQQRIASQNGVKKCASSQNRTSYYV